jgi:hypothetical protein
MVLRPFNGLVTVSNVSLPKATKRVGAGLKESRQQSQHNTTGHYTP